MKKIKNWFVDLWDKFISLFRSSDSNEEENTDSIPLELNQEPTKEQSEADNQNLEGDIKPVDDTQIGDTIIEESVNDEIQLKIQQLQKKDKHQIIQMKL